MPPTLYIALALLAVVVARRLSAVIGSGLGILVAIGLGVWGALTFGQGGGMTFIGVRLSPVVFFGFVVLLGTVEVLNLYVVLRRRRARSPT
jgi:hypothetical protein